MNQSDIGMSDQFNLKNVFATMLRACLGLGAICFMIVTLIGLYGAVDAGYDVINHFRILIVVPGCALALFALCMKARKTAAVTLTALLVHAAAIVPEVYAGWTSPAPEDGAGQFKLVTFNMRFNFADADRLRKFVEAEQPDVLVVQEAWGKAVKAVDGLKDLLPHRLECMDTRLCNLALLSRHPILSGQVEPATMLGARPARPRLLSARLDISGLTGKADQSVTVIDTHLSWPLPQERQVSQFNRIAAQVQATDHSSVILAGDFNSTPWSHAMRRFDAALPLRRVTRAIHSWPARRTLAGFTLPLPLLPIDHVFAGTDFKAQSIRRGPYLGSDHYPVITEFSIAR